MPTQPDSDSPFLPARLEADLGIKREPGTPTMAGKPTVQAGDFSFPAPPAPAAAPAGRPPETNVPQAPAAPAQRKPATTAPGQTVQSPAATAPTADGGVAPLPPGTLTTPTVRADGSVQENLTPEGAQRYRESVVALRTRLGPVPSIFRNAALPEMPVELGRWNYNVWTGQFSK